MLIKSLQCIVIAFYQRYAELMYKIIIPNQFWTLNDFFFITFHGLKCQLWIQAISTSFEVECMKFIDGIYAPREINSMTLYTKPIISH